MENMPATSQYGVQEAGPLLSFSSLPEDLGLSCPKFCSLQLHPPLQRMRRPRRAALCGSDQGGSSQHHGPHATHSAGAFWAPRPVCQAGFWLRPGVGRSPGPTEPLPTQTPPCRLALLLSASQACCPLPGLGTFPRVCSAPSCSPATAPHAVAEWGSSWSPLSTLEEDGPHALLSGQK